MTDDIVYVIENFTDIIATIEGAWAHTALAASIAMALFPQGKDGSAWNAIRTALNRAAVNVGNARNERKTK